MLRESCSEFWQTTKMELFAKTVNAFQPLSIFDKSYILDAWHVQSRRSRSNTFTIAIRREQCETCKFNLIFRCNNITSRLKPVIKHLKVEKTFFLYYFIRWQKNSKMIEKIMFI